MRQFFALRLGTTNLSTLSATYCQLGNAHYSVNDMDMRLVARLMHDRLGEVKAHGNMGNVKKMKVSADALDLTRRQLSIASGLDDKAVKIFVFL